MANDSLCRGFVDDGASGGILAAPAAFAAVALMLALSVAGCSAPGPGHQPSPADVLQDPQDPVTEAPADDPNDQPNEGPNDQPNDQPDGPNGDPEEIPPGTPPPPIQPPPRLRTLTVTGAGTPYPAFEPAIRHYAMICSGGTTVQVAADADRSGVTLKLLRASSADSVVATGRLEAEVTVDSDHDVAIELGAGNATTTYVVHCIPSDFPTVRMLKKTAAVSSGLMFMTPARFMAIVDNNGVPRLHLDLSSGWSSWNFTRHAKGPTIDGKTVQYSVSQGDHAVLFDNRFEQMRTVTVVGDLIAADPHDFLILENGNYLFVSYHRTTRDLCDPPDSCPIPYVDSIIQEVTPLGAEAFRWNSWDHVKLSDCQGADYAHLNSLQVVGGDIIASLAYCAQVLRIDRSGGTGAVEWQLGGTDPPRSSETEYLEIVGDHAGEFCGQHQATLTDNGHVILFDNGVVCHGPRKDKKPFTRVVEYDISSGSQASYVREFSLPPSHGYTSIMGGVTVLENGHWLITWGTHPCAPEGMELEDAIAITEYDPKTGTEVLQVHMSDGHCVSETYRVYREPEAGVSIPLVLP